MNEKTMKQRIEFLEMCENVNCDTIRELSDRIAALEEQLAELIESKRMED